MAPHRVIVSPPQGETAHTLGATFIPKTLETRASTGFSDFFRGAPRGFQVEFRAILWREKRPARREKIHLSHDKKCSSRRGIIFSYEKSSG